MAKYQQDDLVYDIEIRKNLFVLTQFYPAQHKFIISYLEGSNKLSYLDSQNDHYEHGDLMSSYNEDGQAVLNHLAIAANNHETNDQFITRLSQSTNDPEKLVQNFLHPFNQEEKTHQFLIDYINQENPSLKRTGNNNFIFENLANPEDLATFAARYGLVSNFNDAYEGWTTRRLATKNDHMINDIRSLMNFNRQSEGLTLNDYYYPLKDLDFKNSTRQENRGLRIGYNSQEYDETMIAHLLTAYINHNNFFNLMPQAWQYYLKNYQNPMAEYWKQPYGNTKFSVYQAWLLCSIKDFFLNIHQIMPSELTEFNSAMFANRNMSRALEYKTDGFYTKKAYDNTNRYIDLILLLPHKMPLKQVAGTFGFQIKESKSNSDPHQEMPTLKDMADVIAYNISDVYVTNQIFQLSGFQSTYNNRNALISQYEVLNYQHDDSDTKHKMTPATGQPLKVRRDRITVNTTNPRIMENILAPYPNTKLVDKPVVDYMYPAPEVAKENGVKPFDVLENTMQWAIDNIPNGKEVFMPIYKYYLQFRGKNFNREQDGAIANQQKIIAWNDDRVDPMTHSLNDVTSHAETAALTDDDDLVFTNYKGETTRISHKDFTNEVISHLPIQNVPGDFVKYANKEHSAVTASRGWYNASVGGIHGAEDKDDLYRQDVKHEFTYSQYLIALKQNNQFITSLTPDQMLAKWNTSYSKLYNKRLEKHTKDLIHKISRTDRKLLKNRGLKANQTIVLPFPAGEERKVNTVLTFHRDGSFSYKVPQPISKWDGTKVKARYKYTSTGKARHQDFSSYYPTLTVRLRIAVNVDGVDQYRNIYKKRLHNKAIAKNPKNSPEVRKQYKIKQQPQKLLLNSLTGIADAKGNMRSKVRVNNRITQMRIIGQLFAWRIGQALALAGAKIVSTNTDGLYASGIDEKTNDKIVKEQTANMILEVKPEEVDNFISANSNNRLEYANGKISEAKGGTLTAWKGADWTKKLSHPALDDRVLAEYLSQYPDSANQEYNREFAKKKLMDFKDKTLQEENGQETFLRFLQWIMRSNPTSKNFIFANPLKKHGNGWTIDRSKEPEFIEQTNRIFLITPKGQDILNKDQEQPLSLFKANISAVSTLSGAKTHIKNALNNGWANVSNGQMDQINEALSVWKPDITAFDFVNNEKLIDEFIKNFNEMDDVLKKQELYSDNDPLAVKVLTHFLSRADIIDPKNGYEGRILNSLNPKGQPTRDKIIDCSLSKINDFPENHFIYINNRALADYTPETKQAIIDNADYDAYIDIVQNKFEHAWQN